MSRSLGGTVLTTRSPMRIVPSVIVSRPATIRSAVVFPHPDGPDEHDELAVLDLQVQIGDADGPTRVDLADVLQHDLGHGSSFDG